ncbi:hypothetical protein WJX73_005929 [Symbiochloris irregularis]|uniref:Uncharacterized protein n=1 Tax=Symbiochloris irregularis TaxID=706552 RepID=A0AAW1Q0V7_9CHLO
MSLDECVSSRGVLRATDSVSRCHARSYLSRRSASTFALTEAAKFRPFNGGSEQQVAHSPAGALNTRV